MRLSRIHRTSPKILARPYKIIHQYDKNNRLVGTIAILQGNGVYHIGLANPVKGEVARKKQGLTIALTRARLEFAICNGMTYRTARTSREGGMMQTMDKEEILYEIDIIETDLPGHKATAADPVLEVAEQLEQRLTGQAREIAALRAAVERFQEVESFEDAKTDPEIPSLKSKQIPLEGFIVDPEEATGVVASFGAFIES